LKSPKRCTTAAKKIIAPFWLPELLSSRKNFILAEETQIVLPQRFLAAGRYGQGCRRIEN